jgi:tRNA 2-thiouridine synthesizing protein A
MSDNHLDAKGLKCPLPVLKARKALKPLTAGEILYVEATDPGARADFASFCETAGHALLESSEADGVYRFAIRKAE